MKRILFSLMAAVCGTISAHSDIAREAIKQKWMDWADAHVAREKEAFLKKYGIDEAQLHDAPFLEEFTRGYNERSHNVAAQYHQKCMNMDDDAAFVTEIAESIFPGYLKVRILSDSDFPLQQIGSFRNRETKECFIILNATEHAKDVWRLKEILLHELGHLVYEDNFQKELIHCLAWCNSKESREQVEKASFAYCRACVTRADVFVALYSADHGEYLIEHLEELETEPYYPMVLTPAERIELLQKIQYDLM